MDIINLNQKFKLAINSIVLSSDVHSVCTGHEYIGINVNTVVVLIIQYYPDVLTHYITHQIFISISIRII